jgi:hypothetical protein
MNAYPTLKRKDATKFLTEAIPKTFPSINLMPTTANEIRSIIHLLKSKNSCGYDDNINNVSQKLRRLHLSPFKLSLQSINGSRSLPRTT